MKSSMLSDKVYKKRPHRKVKSGCSTCKRRKIKCDEEKPQCSNCARYSANCVYPSSSSENSRGVSMSTTPPLIRTPESLTLEEPTIPQYPAGCNDVPMRDLALLHHWTVSTCLGFGDDFPGSVEPWQVHAPIIGQQFPFLMRGILAISAIHLARSTNDHAVRCKYIRLGAYHQDLALPEYRTAILDVTEENVTAVLVFAALTMVYSFTAPRDPNALFATDAREWLFLHRGVSEVPPHWANWIDRGPFRDEMRRRRLGQIDPMYNPEDFRLLRLHALFSNLHPEDEHERPHYEGALHWLRQAFAHTFAPDEFRLGPKYAILFWIERAPQGYVELLQEERPLAFVILAYCCVLMKRMDHFWYSIGFAEHVMAEIQTYLNNDLMSWIEWPLQVCGMV